MTFTANGNFPNHSSEENILIKVGGILLLFSVTVFIYISEARATSFGIRIFSINMDDVAFMFHFARHQSRFKEMYQGYL